MGESKKPEVDVTDLEGASPEQLEELKEHLSHVMADIIPWVARVKALEGVLLFTAKRQEMLHARLCRLEEAYNLTEEDLLSGKKVQVGPTPQEVFTDLSSSMILKKLLSDLTDEVKEAKTAMEEGEEP